MDLALPDRRFTRAEIVEEALRWLHTPVIWQQSVRGRGCDCKGLIWGIARELGMPEADNQYARARDYRKVDPVRLLEGIRETFDPAPDRPRPADVLLMPLGRDQYPVHLGIMVSESELLHARPSSNMVVRVPLGRSRPIHSVWQWRSLME